DRPRAKRQQTTPDAPESNPSSHTDLRISIRTQSQPKIANLSGLFQINISYFFTEPVMLRKKCTDYFL
ncbi:hypothetical protein ACJBTR_10705, partial [Streptococcus suis]